LQQSAMNSATVFMKSHLSECEHYIYINQMYAPD